MRTLITGSTGLVGNNVLRLLLDQGHEVCALVRDPGNERPFAGLDVEFRAGDVRDVAAVRRAFEGVSGVIHAAAYVQIGWTRLEDQRSINVEGTRNVASAALDAGVRMVHVSSTDALGIGKPDQPADEDSRIEGKVPCAYVVSKREAEQALREQIDLGLNAVTVNPGLMFGPWDWKPSSGRMLIQVGTRLTPVAPTGGASVCDVRDVAKATIEALKSGKSGLRYILGGHNVTYMDLWKVMARVAGAAAPMMRAGPVLRIIGGLGGDIWGKVTGHEPDLNSAAVQMSSQFHYYDSARAQRELGYRIRPLEETVADAWQWFQENGYV